MSSVISEDRTQVLPDGTEINFCTSGSGSRVVLLLPGALGTGRTDFTPQLESLNSSGKLTLIAWDPPGYGKSRPPNRTFPNNFFERDAKVALNFMKSLGHERYALSLLLRIQTIVCNCLYDISRFSIVGWSDGGITALFMAAMFVDNIEKMIAHAANAYFEVYSYPIHFCSLML